ncbi:MAG: DNA (cytosine-5-)-methyltransferase, partial [Chloroflexi bacterium]
EILKKQDHEKPTLVLLENVNGWLTSNNGDDFRLTIKALNSLGYACDVISLDAIRFTPQSRPRVFVFGMQIDHPNQDALRLIRRPESIATKTLKNTLESNFDLNWHILEIPEPPSAKKSGLSKIVEFLQDDDERWWSHEQVSKHLEMMHDTHRIRILNHIDDKNFTFRTMYRRVRKGKQRAEVRANDTAGCLRTARGGSSRQMVVQIGKGEVKMRHMTPREYARLQGVPDDYPISLGINQSLTGFGDAVCVPVITWIAQNILNPLANQLLVNK